MDFHHDRCFCNPQVIEVMKFTQTMVAIEVMLIMELATAAWEVNNLVLQINRLATKPHVIH
jgi:hypothetical protein